MINRVVLMGRLVSDPELKTTQGGTNVTTFRIAVDRNYVKAGEERQADFFDIVAWRYTAEFVCKHFRKGSLIAIDGELRSRSYEASDGTNRRVVEVEADHAYFTGERAKPLVGVDVPSVSESVQEREFQSNTSIQQSFDDVTPRITADDDFPF